VAFQRLVTRSSRFPGRRRATAARRRAGVATAVQPALSPTSRSSSISTRLALPSRRKQTNAPSAYGDALRPAYALRSATRIRWRTDRRAKPRVDAFRRAARVLPAAPKPRTRISRAFVVEARSSGALQGRRAPLPTAGPKNRDERSPRGSPGLAEPALHSGAREELPDRPAAPVPPRLKTSVQPVRRNGSVRARPEARRRGGRSGLNEIAALDRGSRRPGAPRNTFRDAIPRSGLGVEPSRSDRGRGTPAKIPSPPSTTKSLVTSATLLVVRRWGRARFALRQTVNRQRTRRRMRAVTCTPREAQDAVDRPRGCFATMRRSSAPVTCTSANRLSNGSTS